MRILQISSSKTFGGGERHFVDLCRGLAESGNEVFAAVRPTNEWQSKLDFLPPENIFHISIRNSFGILSAKRLARFINENRIEIVHAHVARDYIPASIACKLAADARFVLTRHLTFPLKPFNRYALTNLSKAIAVSPAVAASLLKVFRPSQIITISNGIDLRDWAGVDRNQLGKEFRFLHQIPFDVPFVGIIGELIVLKGQRDFLLAANEISARFPEARFVVVGKDNTFDKKFRRELKRLAKVFGIEERFLWLDWVEDPRPLFAALDIMVSASHTESFGLAILEAISCGTGVVATSTDGAREIVHEKELLVPIKDPLAIANTVCRLLDDRDWRKNVVERTRISAAERFSAEKMVSETLRLYRDVLDGN